MEGRFVRAQKHWKGVGEFLRHICLFKFSLWDTISLQDLRLVVNKAVTTIVLMPKTGEIDTKYEDYYQEA